MSYLVLARKWRPQTFADVIGQKPVVLTLQNALRRNRVPHALLFGGVRGVGKTTLARIMAKALNCEQGPTAEPCGLCNACQDIATGSALDIYEIDGASNRGIQEIRELKENIRFYPTQRRYKIIIIDEVHMLTEPAFNALLKTLEEPPPHVYFMFATTDVHKIPVTILSRCQRHELKRVAFAELASFFKKIAMSETVTISERALALIAREAEGSVRDGLSLLDQIFSFGGSVIADEDVREVLGLVDSKLLEDLAQALLGKNLEEGLSLLERIYTVGVDAKRFCLDLLGYFRSIILCKVSANPSAFLDLPEEELQTLKELAAAHSEETLYHYFHLLLTGVGDMQYAPHPRMVLEMSFIKAVQTRNLIPLASLVERLDALLLQGHSPVGLLPVKKVRAEGESSDVRRRFEQQSEAISKPSFRGASDSSTLDRSVKKDWEGFVQFVKKKKPWMGGTLRLASGVSEKGHEVHIRYDNPSDCKVLQESENLKTLTEYAQDFFQREIVVKISHQGLEGMGGAAADGGSPQEDRRSLAHDPFVQSVVEIFGGQVSGIRTGTGSR